MKLTRSVLTEGYEERIAQAGLKEANRLMQRKYRRGSTWNPFIIRWVLHGDTISFYFELIQARNRKTMAEDPETAVILRRAMHKAIKDNMVEIIKGRIENA